ncbi:MAG: hypothetical protein AMXMBFR7_47020 [Planctomycetota bacterium]|nr:hypothetical protein [Planctomycetota bacterium]
MAKKGKKAAGKGKASTEGLVVGSKVKNYVKSKGLKSSGELIDAVSACVACCLDKAVDRAKANKRSTVRPGDL